MIAIAKIQEVGTHRNWQERFEVDSQTSAVGDIQRVIQRFNNTLKPSELPRQLDTILSFEEEVFDETDLWKAYWIGETTEVFLARSALEALACLYEMVRNSYRDDEIEWGEVDLDGEMTEEDGTKLTIRQWIELHRPTQAFQLLSTYS